MLLKYAGCFALFIVLLSGLLPTSRAAEPAQLNIAAVGDGVQITWNIQPNALAELTQIEWQGLRIPARLITLQVPANATPRPVITINSTLPWQAPLVDSTTIVPMQRGVARPALAVAPKRELPTQPAFVLREATIRGVRVVVVAVTPVFAAHDQSMLASSGAVFVPHATLFDVNAPLPDATFGVAVPPTNPPAKRASWRISVQTAGMQRLSGNDLAAVGVNLQTLAPNTLQVWRDGVPVAAEEIGTSDGQFAATDYLQFYAPPINDRWNNTAAYWLTIEPTPALRMISRDTTPTTAPLRTTAWDYGVWRKNTLYDSGLAGVDGDHWYAADLRTGAGLPAATYAFSLPTTLPVAGGSISLTVTGAAYTANQHQLKIKLGTAEITQTWSGIGAWSHSVTLTTTAASGSLTLVPAVAADGVLFDSIEWQRLGVLDLKQRGAWFRGVAGTWHYQLSGVANSSVLYDVSQPNAPVRLTLTAGGTKDFQDTSTNREYLVVGTGTLATPTITPHQPTDWTQRADVVMIAPAAFHANLAPLVAHRQAQGYSVRVIDPAAIYAAWSGGDLDPAAIRAFLRHAAATWNPAPTAVLLVGDGSSDPLNYTGKANATFVPPFLATVDPWLGETACDTCYAQLDGDDPLSDLLPDLLIGRLPVHSAAEVATVVQKIINYETQPHDMAWRSRVAFVADNYRSANGTADAAGDFAKYADKLVALQPANVSVERMYYDPWGKDANGQPLNQAWREPNAAQARTKTIAMLNRSASVITYVGHGNQWQWASTEPLLPEPYLLNLYDPDAMTNAQRLPIALSLTCLTSAFHEPAWSTTSLDERMVISPNGAIATWGSTGFGVAHGHDLLAQGFFTSLWSVTPPATLGSLVQAGQLTLFEAGGCCQDALRTFAVLGDPLLRPQAVSPKRIYTPLITR